MLESKGTSLINNDLPNPDGPIDYTDIYPDTHLDNIAFINSAKDLLVAALRQRFDRAFNLQFVPRLPENLKHHPQFVYFRFRDRARGTLWDVRFDRKSDGKPDFVLKPMVDPQITHV